MSSVEGAADLSVDGAFVSSDVGVSSVEGAADLSVDGAFVSSDVGVSSVEGAVDLSVDGAFVSSDVTSGVKSTSSVSLVSNVTVTVPVVSVPGTRVSSEVGVSSVEGATDLSVEGAFDVGVSSVEGAADLSEDGTFV